MQIDLPKMASNAAGALSRVAAAIRDSDPLLADKATKEKRLSVCKTCRYLSDGQCSECLCFVRAKAILATETCPKNFW